MAYYRPGSGITARTPFLERLRPTKLTIGQLALGLRHSLVPPSAVGWAESQIRGYGIILLALVLWAGNQVRDFGTPTLTFLT